jgi:hypothetical protein
MRVLIGCEYSQEVTKAFRERGHEAYSCDLLPADGGHPEWHFQEDIFYVLKHERFDFAGFHPPCTHLAVSGARHFPEKKADGRQDAALQFVRNLMNVSIKKWYIENPISIISSQIRKPDQIIQPWQFGHGETKATCLWLKGLPMLKPTNIVEGRYQRCFLLPPSKDRWKLRSTTYTGIAKAMAAQWSNPSMGVMRQEKTSQIKLF